MSLYDDDDFEDDGLDAGSNAVKELRKANRAKEKQLKELQEELQSMRASLRERSVKDVLAAKGLPEKISRFIPESATTSDEVEAWLAENGDVFGVTPQANEASTTPQQSDPTLDALGRISQVQSTGQPFTNDPDQLSALIKSASTPEELNKLLFGTTAGPQAI